MSLEELVIFAFFLLGIKEIFLFLLFHLQSYNLAKWSFNRSAWAVICVHNNPFYNFGCKDTTFFGHMQIILHNYDEKDGKDKKDGRAEQTGTYKRTETPKPTYNAGTIDIVTR